MSSKEELTGMPITAYLKACGNDRMKENACVVNARNGESTCDGTGDRYSVTVNPRYVFSVKDRVALYSRNFWDKHTTENGSLDAEYNVLEKLLAHQLKYYLQGLQDSRDDLVCCVEE